MLDTFDIRALAESAAVEAQLQEAVAASEPLRPTATKLVEWRNRSHGHLDHGVVVGPSDESRPKVSLEALVDVSFALDYYFFYIFLFFIMFI